MANSREISVRIAVAAAFAAVATVCAPSAALAQSKAPADAAEQLGLLRIWNARLLSAKPALADLEVEINRDCREKLPSKVDFVSYCSCARAVVMYLWVTAGDEAMAARVEDFAKGSSKLKAVEFLQYQGPELYKPFCDLALGVS
jgi:hypothetical protein